MRRLFIPFFLFFSAVSLALTQLGCAVNEEVVTQTTGSTPNAYLIEQKVEAQQARINQGLQTGDLESAMALGLTETDEMVKRLSLKLRISNPSHDLTSSQTALLGYIVHGNNEAIDDALQRRDLWVQAFDGNGTYDYSLRGDRLLFISVLQANLKIQENTANSATQAGNMTPDQAREAQDRIQSVRDAETGDFRQNGGLELNTDQVLELQQMAESSAHFIRFLAQGVGGGAFAQDYVSPSGGYATQAFANANSYSVTTGTTIGAGVVSNPAAATHYWDGRPNQSRAVAAKNSPTPVPPPPTATFTPVPPAPTQTFTPVPPPDTPTPFVSFPTSVPGSSFMASPARPERSFSTIVGQTGPVAKPAPSSQPAPSNQPQPATASPSSVTYLPADSLKARDKQLDQLMDAAKKQGKGRQGQFNTASQIRKAFHKAVKADLLANQQKGLTQDQLDQLSKMLDDFAKAVSELDSSGLPTPAPGK